MERMENEPQVRARARRLLPEEQTAGTDDAAAQAEAIIEDSTARQNDRNAAPGSVVEHRTSDEATPPAE
jgi:hypothetical protein